MTFFWIFYPENKKKYWMVTEMCLPFSSIQWDWMFTERSLNSAWNPDFSEHSEGIQWTFRNVSVDWKENFHPVPCVIVQHYFIAFIVEYFFIFALLIKEENPHPGQWYKGIQRSGYVPNNEKGRLVAKLLNVAFSRRLVFTIGRSRTTGKDGVIIWNDIHHKTRIYGGPEK